MSTPFPENITIEDFKRYFAMRRAFSFSTYRKYDVATEFNLNEKVYEDYTFATYLSQISNNIGNALTDAGAWVLNETEPNLVFDEMITQAFELAVARPFACVFKEEKNKPAYLLLTAHYLQLILNARNGNLGIGVDGGGVVTSVSSISTSVGKSLLPNFDLSMAEITSTPFGAEYEAMLKRRPPKFFIAKAPEDYSYDPVF